MNTKKILSLALTLVLAFSMVFSLFAPVVSAEGADQLGDKEKYEALKAIDYRNYIYSSPEEKLATMTKVMENEGYAFFIQEYTAEICVVDKVTGQMLFSNPYDVADTKASDTIKDELLSQIIISYSAQDNIAHNFNSYFNGAVEEQIQIKKIRGGVRVQYSIGESVKKRIVPFQIEKSRFEEFVLKPFYENTKMGDYSFEEYYAMKNSDDPMEAMKATASEGFEFGRLAAFYSLLDLEAKGLTAREQASILSKYPITERMDIYILDEEISSQDLTILESYIRSNTEYSLNDMLSDHEKVGYVMKDTSPALFKMALEYYLEDDGFSVRLPARGISFDAATYTLNTIQVLPYFGAGRTGAEGAIRQDKGYNFIPDGSGSTISFDHNKLFTQVSGTMYGNDFGFYSTASAKTASYQTWRVPVYGTVMTSNMTVRDFITNKDGNYVLDDDGNKTFTKEEVREPVTQGYVAFITEGESLTRIDAIDGGVTHDYHAVSTTFFARQTDSYPLDGITVSGDVAVYTKPIDRKYVGNYSIHYRMLWEEEANYVGMANAYRAYLIKNGQLEKLAEQEKDINLYLDLLGDIDTTKTFLGMPVAGKAKLTTFADAKTIMSELKEAGVANQVIRYLGWANGGLSATAPAKIKVEKALGGEDGLRDLISYAQSEGNQIYMDFDFAYVTKTDMFDGFDLEADSAKTIDGKTAFFQTYNPIVQAYNTQVSMAISAKAYTSLYHKISEKYASFFGDGQKNFAAGSLGFALNSSQDSAYPLNREDAKEQTEFALENIAKDYDSVLVECGNYYTWAYADTILEIPLDSSNRNTTTNEVPLLGILLHGYKNYTGEAINLSGDYEYTLLKTIESGANPYFIIAYNNNGLKVNGYSEYYAVEYAQWKESIAEEYKKINEVLSPLQGQHITDHEIMDNRVVKVTYEEGTEIYLNYNNFAITVDSLEIDAMGFAVVNA
ncbi:MAG: hypothetical protein IKT50_01580 [Clostridia bacterium]|nr:hypothetical protein [Clostridia bacterium]